MSVLTINTTQNVVLNFTAASISERIFASVLDILIKIAYCIVVAVVFLHWLDLGKKLDTMDNWSAIAVGILLFFPVLIYSIFLESIFEGQTIGKKLLKIKVVKIDGYQAGFGDYLIRWLFRIIENNIMAGAIAITSLIMSNKGQRLGDRAAGTSIISLKNKVTINSTILEEIDLEYIPTYPMVIKLSDNDMRIIKDTFLMAKAKNDIDTISKLRDKIESVCGIKRQSISSNEFVSIILKDYNFYTQNM